MGADYKMGVDTPTGGFYKMAARSFRCVDVKYAIGMGCNPFCRKWVYCHACSPRWSLQNWCWKLSQSTNSQSTSKEMLYKMTSSLKRKVDLQNGVAHPTYSQNQVDKYQSYFAKRPHPFCRGNWRGDKYVHNIIGSRISSPIF